MTTWDEAYVKFRLHRETPEEQSFWRRITRPPVSRPCKKSDERFRFIMGMVAYNSGAQEGAAWQQWDLHRDALVQAFCMGQAHKPIHIYQFLTWHRAILPFGGTLRNSDPVSIGMGESFAPLAVDVLPREINLFVKSWNQVLSSDTRPPLETLAWLHFSQWQMHPFPDGNKRHCRLLTTYGCGWYNLPPVNITVVERPQYLDMLAGANIKGLARLFQACAIEVV